MIHKTYGKKMCGIIELNNIHNHYWKMNYQVSLAYLARKFCDFIMEKDMSIRCGAWNAQILNDKQIYYAACDSHYSLFVFENMMKKSANEINYITYMYKDIKHFDHRSL
jgi:ribonuclease D